MKQALKGRDISRAKIIAAELKELGYQPREIDGTVSEMRLRINILIMNIRERYDVLADKSDVSGCCLCQETLSEITDLLTDNQENDLEEYSLCSAYPTLCKYELFNKNIIESLKNRQIDRAKRLKTLLISLEYEPNKGYPFATAGDMKERLKNTEERLKERYITSAEKADIDDSISCIELLTKVQHLLIEGERALAQAVSESEIDSVLPADTSFSAYGWAGTVNGFGTGTVNGTVNGNSYGNSYGNGFGTIHGNGFTGTADSSFSSSILPQNAYHRAPGTLGGGGSMNGQNPVLTSNASNASNASNNYLTQNVSVSTILNGQIPSTSYNEIAGTVTSTPSKTPSKINENVAKSPSQSYISKYLAASSGLQETENTILSGKWWLDDGDEK